VTLTTHPIQRRG